MAVVLPAVVLPAVVLPAVVLPAVVLPGGDALQCCSAVVLLQPCCRRPGGRAYGSAPGGWRC